MSSRKRRSEKASFAISNSSWIGAVEKSPCSSCGSLASLYSRSRFSFGSGRSSAARTRSRACPNSVDWNARAFSRYTCGR
jgi:hypothetical protein